MSETVEPWEMTWEQAYEWEQVANVDREEFNEPQWKFDCGKKLDFDGPLLSISSRFYPPPYNTHEGWQGQVTLFAVEQEICSKEFKCLTLNELRTQVETYHKYLLNKFVQAFKEAAGD